MSPYYVLLWDFNKKQPEYYDIMPYLINTFNEEKKCKFKVFCKDGEPETFEQFKEFILNACRYQFWSRCEYEFIMVQWPYNEKNPLKDSKKIDAYEQIKMNINIITQHFINEINQNMKVC